MKKCMKSPKRGFPSTIYNGSMENAAAPFGQKRGPADCSARASVFLLLATKRKGLVERPQLCNVLIRTVSVNDNIGKRLFNFSKLAFRQGNFCRSEIFF